MKKLVCLLLALCMLVPALIACNTDAKPADTTVDSSNETTDAVSETVDDTPKPDLPDKTFDGETYSVLAAAEQWIRNITVDAEEIEGDIVAQAIYDRNESVMEQYDVVLDYVVFNGYGAGITIVDSALLDSLSGANYYDLSIGLVSYMTPHLQKGYFTDLNRVEYLGLDQPWYHQYVNEELTINGKLYLAASHLGLNNVSSMLVTFFNKAVQKNNNMEDFYPLVDDYKWTFDKMLTLAEAASRDLNQDGAIGLEDVFGVASTFDYTAGLVTGFGTTLVTRNEEGTPVLTGATEKVIDINDKMYALMSSDFYMDAYKFAENTGNLVMQTMTGQFASDSALFLIFTMGTASSDELRAMDDYGVLPTPLYDEDQSSYYANVVAEVFGIPASVNSLEFSAIIAQALAYESYTTLTPAYFENAMKEKYAKNPEIPAMLDFIAQNTICDFAYMFGRSLGTALIYQLGKTNSYASWAASNLPAIEIKLADLIQSIEQMGEE